MICKHKSIRKCNSKGCDNTFTPTWTILQKYCSHECFWKEQNKKPRKPNKPIKPVSKKLKSNLSLYTPSRIKFLSKEENQKCFIEGCSEKATTIEHIKGRKGFADKWARDNNIPLLLDQRFWKGCCLHHNGELENNPELSNKYQLSRIHEGKKIKKGNL